MHMAQEWAIKANKSKVNIVIPKEYQCHWKVFSKEEAQCFPPERVDDYAINLKLGAPETIDCKVYPLNAQEEEACHKFINENVDKGYLCLSKLAYASPFFFIKKKDGSL